MLKKYQAIILKPKYGDLGMGIISIAKKRFLMPLYLFEHQVKNENGAEIHKNYHFSLNKISGLMKMLWPRKQSYLIQEKLAVAKFQKCFFDLRIIMEKENNHWVNAMLRARIAPPRGFLANFSAGGKTMASGQKIIRSVFPQKTEMITKKINALSINLAQFLECSTGKTIELGLDFILDQKGKIWIIEANSKPGRCLFSQKEQGLITFPLVYLKWLANKKSPV